MFRRLLLWCAVVFLMSCASTQPAAPLTKIVVGMPYIPNIQFAHFYTAHAKGYFKDAGLDVTFDYNFENDVVQRVATGNGIQFALASADSILLARAQGVPVKAVMATSQAFPIAFISKSTQVLSTPADLVGKKIGIPGRFGASYIGLKALLAAGNIAEDAVTIEEIGFNQVPVLLQDNVDVISGYANNEPIQLAAQGTSVSVLRVADFAPIASDHLIVSESYLQNNRQIVEQFAAALRKGMETVQSDPSAAYNDAVAFIPELKPDAKNVTIQVLQATVGFWTANNSAIGVIHPAQWEATHGLLRGMELLKSDIPIADAYDTTVVK